MTTFLPKYALALITALGMAAAIQSCSTSEVPPPPPKQIKVDGSSTVFPITRAVADQYNQLNYGKIEVKSDFSGTGGGFKKFCAGETDISDASRPILTKEIDVCRANKVKYIELPIAYDALTVVVNPKNTWAKDLTTTELKKIWSANGGIKTWKQVRPGFPNRPITLYGAGKDSGTYDYFKDAILGKDGVHTEKYTASEDDNQLVAGVAADPNALGYFGFAYYQQNQDKLKPVAINHGKGAVLPSVEAVNNLKYQPLARPLFIYVNFASTQRKEVNTFVSFYLDNVSKIVEKVGYIPLPEAGINLSKETLSKGEVGTVFEGKSEVSLPIAELLKKRATF
ncbi:MAG: PstS family phosphate ABC transporter substrate-binding protein [Pseudanabaenaceae cyanobacterium bins.68]|nr:PstS family phosphate ABC transporter substrate-binding protein [Pseudanabaenaceae cyanobacterium bins.68]